MALKNVTNEWSWKTAREVPAENGVHTEKNICLNLPNYLETHDRILKRRILF